MYRLLALALALGGCVSTAGTKKEAKRKSTPAATGEVADTCKRGRIRECEGGVRAALRDNKLDEAEALARKLMNVRRTEGLELVNAVGDARRLRAAARDASRAACDDGNVRACTVLANALIAEKELKQGLELLRNACRLNDGKACHDAAGYLDSPKEINELLARSCDLSFPAGCHAFAELLATGDQPALAAKAYDKACALDYAPSCAEQAQAAFTAGAYDVAQKNGEKGCRGGVSFACFVQAMAASQLGRPDEARRVLDELCKTEAFACRELALLEVSKGRKTAARKYLDSACERNDAPACMLIARDEEAAGETASALARYRKLCDGPSGFGQACFNAAMLLDKATSAAEVTQRLQRACERDVGVACLKLGYASAKAKDQKVANQYFTVACKAGEATACDMLGKPLPKTPTGGLISVKKPEDADKDCDNGSLEACWTLTGLTKLAH